MFWYSVLERGGHAKNILQDYNLAGVDGYDILCLKITFRIF